MPRPITDKTIQVPEALHEHIKQETIKESSKLNLSKPMSMADYLRRLTKFK